MKFQVKKGGCPPLCLFVEIPDHFLGGSGEQGPAGPEGPEGPPGPGEDFGPLSNTVFVDGGTTVPDPDQDGSIARPFETVTEALAAIGSFATPYTIFMTPGDYSGEADIALPATPNISIGFVGFSAYYGLGAVTPELSAIMPGFTGGDSTQIIHFVNCIWNTRPITPAGTLRMDWCRVLGASGSALFTANNMTLYYSTITQRIATTGTVSARNVDFLGAGDLITVATAGSTVRAYLCRFDPAATIAIVFTGGTGNFLIDGVTNFHWEAATETLTGGTKVIQEDLTV